MQKIRIPFGFEINAHFHCDIFGSLPEASVAFAELMHIEGDTIGLQCGTQFGFASREAALDCLTGEADSAMANLKVAIQLRSENRYHARNDEDFAFLQEDPRFTELLYPEKDGTAG